MRVGSQKAQHVTQIKNSFYSGIWEIYDGSCMIFTYFKLGKNKPNQEQTPPVNCLVDLLLIITYFKQQLSSHCTFGHCKGESKSNAAHMVENNRVILRFKKGYLVKRLNYDSVCRRKFQYVRARWVQDQWDEAQLWPAY